MLTLIGLGIAIFGLVLIIQGVQGKQGALRSLGGLALVAGIVVAFLSNAFVVVPAGSRGVVFNVFGGVQEQERGEGFHIVLPFLQEVTLFTAREQSVTFAAETNDSIEALSREGLDIGVDTTVRFRIIPDEADSIFQELGTDYVNTLIRPKVRSLVREVVANYNAADLISTQRTAAQEQIKQNLGESLESDNLELLDVLLRDIRIPATISAAIEEKQAAEQQVQIEENRRDQSRIAAERAVIEAEGKRDAAIAAAEGESRALTLRGEAIRSNPEIIQLEVAQRLAPSIQTIMLPSEGNFLLDVRGMIGEPSALPLQQP